MEKNNGFYVAVVAMLMFLTLVLAGFSLAIASIFEVAAIRFILVIVVGLFIGWFANLLNKKYSFSNIRQVVLGVIVPLPFIFIASFVYFVISGFSSILKYANEGNTSIAFTATPSFAETVIMFLVYYVCFNLLIAWTQIKEKKSLKYYLFAIVGFIGAVGIAKAVSIVLLTAQL
jgi:hypothetical protein